MQIKIFQNGVKAILNNRSSSRGMLSILDKNNFVVAQREIQKKGDDLFKLTVRANDRYQPDIELLKMCKGGSSRYCWSAFGDKVHVNNTFRKSNHYYNQSRVSFKNELEEMPIYISSRKINTKREELGKRIDDIMKQWVGKGFKEKKNPKPMNINI